MLNSCGSGVTVVNIDNGFGAGYAASQINELASPARRSQRLKTLYLDIFSGISGDMFMGAMLDLGVDCARWSRNWPNCRSAAITCTSHRAKRRQIEGVKFDVHLGPDHPTSMSHGHEPRS